MTSSPVAHFPPSSTRGSLSPAPSASTSGGAAAAGAVRFAFSEPCSSCGCVCRTGSTRSLLPQAVSEPDVASRFLVSVLFQGRPIVVCCLESDCVRDLKLGLCNSNRCPMADERHVAITDLDGAVLGDRRPIEPFIRRSLDGSSAPPPSLCAVEIAGSSARLALSDALPIPTVAVPLGRQSSPNVLLAAAAMLATFDQRQEQVRNVVLPPSPGQKAPAAVARLARPKSAAVVTPRAESAIRSLQAMRRHRQSPSFEPTYPGLCSPSSASTSCSTSMTPSPTLSRATSPATPSPAQATARPPSGFELSRSVKRESLAHSCPRTLQSATSDAVFVTEGFPVAAGKADPLLRSDGTRSSRGSSRAAAVGASPLAKRAENSALTSSRSQSPPRDWSREISPVVCELPRPAGLDTIAQSAWLQSLGGHATPTPAPRSRTTPIPLHAIQSPPSPLLTSTPSTSLTLDDPVIVKDISEFGFTEADMAAADQRCLRFSRPRKRSRPVTAAAAGTGTDAAEAAAAGPAAPCDTETLAKEPCRKRQRRWAPKEELTFTGMYSAFIREFAKSTNARARWYDCVCGAFENPVQLSKLKQHVTSSSKIHRLYTESLAREAEAVARHREQE